MQVNLKRIEGPWEDGYVLDKHTLKSDYIGDNEQGYPKFDTTRSETGEALYQLKYASDFSQAKPIARAIHDHILPHFRVISVIVPVPASTPRPRQPVTEIANELAELINVSVFNNIVKTAPLPPHAPKLKDLGTKEEKVEALKDRFSLNDEIKGEHSWNALLLDDLYDTGATMEAVCAILQTYPKIANVYAAAVTWK